MYEKYKRSDSLLRRGARAYYLLHNKIMDIIYLEKLNAGMAKVINGDGKITTIPEDKIYVRRQDFAD